MKRSFALLVLLWLPLAVLGAPPAEAKPAAEKKQEGKIDWSKEAKEIDRQVRALNPWPGAFAEWNGQLLKIYKGEVREVYLKKR